MLTSEQVDYYNRWRTKADLIVTDSIEECIDKYFTLFVVYNFLYNIVPWKVAMHAGTAVKNNGDKISATKGVINFLTPTSILTNLTDKNNDKDITHLQGAMSHFNISLDKQGYPKPQVDTQLRNGLLSTQPAVKALALLETIYYIRCNIFHGHKGLIAYQMMLVHPVINILSSINIQLFNTLINYPV